MSQDGANSSTAEVSLKEIFDEAMKLYDKIENGNEATNSDPVQVSLCCQTFKICLYFSLSNLL